MTAALLKYFSFEDSKKGTIRTVLVLFETSQKRLIVFDEASCARENRSLSSLFRNQGVRKSSG
jgi:hypothetical protein